MLSKILENTPYTNIYDEALEEEPIPELGVDPPIAEHSLPSSQEPAIEPEPEELKPTRE
jgi:hypothetical protein